MHAAQSYGKTDNSMPSGNGFPDSTAFWAVRAVRRALLGASAVALVLALLVVPAGADSFTPVMMSP